MKSLLVAHASRTHTMKLITVKGTVIRSGGVEMIEYDRHQICRKCKYRSVCELIQLQLDFVPSLLVPVRESPSLILDN